MDGFGDESNSFFGKECGPWLRDRVVKYRVGLGGVVGAWLVWLMYGCGDSEQIRVALTRRAQQEQRTTENRISVDRGG